MAGRARARRVSPPAGMREGAESAAGAAARERSGRHRRLKPARPAAVAEGSSLWCPRAARYIRTWMLGSAPPLSRLWPDTRVWHEAGPTASVFSVIVRRLVSQAGREHAVGHPDGGGVG